MDLSKCLDEELLQSKRLTFFCGAGISRDSNIPTVNDTYLYLSTLLTTNTHDATLLENLLCSHNVPFERVMQLLIQNTSNDSFMDIYNLGLPNINHITIAKLAKAGYVKNIITTNFDLLFEQALETEGLREGSDYMIYFSEQQFEAAVKDVGKFIRLIKIHGSSGASQEHKQSVRVTLSTIVRQVLSNKRQQVISHIFSENTQDYVVFLGYSFSDIFDITPHILAIKDAIKTKTIIIEHAPALYIEDIGVKKVKNPFAGTVGSGYRMQMPTANFVRQLWKLLPTQDYVGVLTTAKMKITQNPFGWQIFFDNWLSAGLPGLAAHLTSKLFDLYDRADLQLKYALVAYEWSLSFSMAAWQAEMILQMGFACINNKKLEEANEWYGKGIQLVNENELNIGKDSAMKLLSKFYFQQGRFFEDYENDYKTAIKLYGISYRLDCKISDDEGKSKTLHQLGSILLNNSFKLAQADKCNNKAKHIKEELGDLAGIAKSILQTGNYYFINKAYPEALAHYEEALEVVNKVGEFDLQGRLYHNIASVYHNMNIPDKADRNYNKAIFYKSLTPHNITLTSTLGNKGELYYSLGYYTIAYSLFRKELNISLYFNNTYGMLNSYAMLFRVFTYADYFVFSSSELAEYLQAGYAIITDNKTVIDRAVGDFYFSLAEFEYVVNRNIEQADIYLNIAKPLLTKYLDYKFMDEFWELKELAENH